MTTEELDALDAMIREAHFEVIEDYEGTHLATIPASVETLDALVNAAPRLLAEAREAATLRAKLAEVTGQRDELREAADAFTDHIDGLDCNVYWPRLAKAIEAAR